MEFSTEHKSQGEVQEAEILEMVQQHMEKQWERIVKRLPIDLEQSAREMKAIQRVRKITTAFDLLRINLFYALCDYPLRLVGAWALCQEIAYVSDVAILKRLRSSKEWIGKLVTTLLERRCAALKEMPGVRVRLMDATSVSKPGSHTTDWRTHVSFDLENLCMTGVEITNVHGGEKLTRFEPQNNEIRIADGAYSTLNGMGPFLKEGAGLIVRINWRNVPMESENGRFEIIPWLKRLTGPAEQQVWVETPQGRFVMRLIAAPLPPEKAEKARRKAKERNQRKQNRHQPTENTLFAAGFVLLLTNLPAEKWPIRLVLALYGVRWQVELVFKRLKGLILFDNLRAKDPQLAQTYLLSKILIALLIDELTSDFRFTELDWFVSLERPASISRMTQLLLGILRQYVFGSCLIRDLQSKLVLLRRYLCDSPRARPQQLAWARALVSHFNLTLWALS